MQESFTFEYAHHGEAERWLPAVGWEGSYEVSDLGRVWSVRRSAGTRIYGGQMRKPELRKGYLSVTLWRNGRGVHGQVHRLVAAAFLGPCPEGQEVRHGSGGALDNRATNLSYGTHRQNTGPDKVRDGTLARGETHGMAILTEAQAVEVRARYVAGEDRRSLAHAYGIRKETVSQIALGNTWGHVPGTLAPHGQLRGEACVQAKLTAANVTEIRHRYAGGGVTKTALAREFGVSLSNICHIINGETWRHVA